MEKAGFKNIQKLLEIFERERHHEILLPVRNLRELSRNPSPYILPVIPHPLPTEIVEGEHYVIADLLNLALSSSSPAQTSETEVVGWELVISLRLEHPSLALPLNHLRRLIGIVVTSVFLLLKRAPVLPPKHLRREDGCLNGEERLERGWKILSLGLPRYLAPPPPPPPPPPPH